MPSEAAKPASMEQVIGVYQSILTQYAAKMPGYVKAFQAATGDKIEGFTPDEIEIMNGPFMLTTAPKASMDWVRDATGGWAVQMTGRARFVFAKLNELDLTHPIAKGMPQQSIAWFENSPAFEEVRVTPLGVHPPGGETPKGVTLTVIARYPSDPSKILLSGWALGADKIAGKAALVEFTVGKGKIVLFGFRPQYRGQSLATFPLLFNAISN